MTEKEKKEKRRINKQRLQLGYLGTTPRPRLSGYGCQPSAKNTGVVLSQKLPKLSAFFWGVKCHGGTKREGDRTGRSRNHSEVPGTRPDSKRLETGASGLPRAGPSGGAVGAPASPNYLDRALKLPTKKRETRAKQPQEIVGGGPRATGSGRRRSF